MYKGVIMSYLPTTNWGRLIDNMKNAVKNRKEQNAKKFGENDVAMLHISVPAKPINKIGRLPNLKNVRTDSY